MAKLLRVGVKEVSKMIRSAIKPMMKKKKNTKSSKRTISRQLQSNRMVLQTAPVAKSAIMRNPPPLFNGKKEFVICKREEVTNLITGNQSWSLEIFLSCNPGNAECFPYLSGIANLFEFYSFRKLKFIYVPFAPTTQNGSILMAPDYDSSDVAPQVENAMSDYADFVEGPNWTQIECVFNPASMNKFSRWRYVRGGQSIGAAANPIYDAVNFLLATTNFSADSTKCGKLFVEYEVELDVPTLPPSGASNQAYGGRVDGSTAAGGTGASPLTNATIDVDAKGFSINAPAADGHTHVFITNVGQYLVTLAVTKALAGVSVGTLSIAGGIGNSVNVLDSVSSTGNTMSQYVLIVNDLGSNGVYLNWTGATDGCTEYRMVIASVPPSSIS